MTDPKLRVLISAEQIQARIKELGEKISADYPTGNLHMICILKGAVFFIADLMDKPERRLRPVHVSYVGFEIPDEFVVGYGLDYAEKYRNLDDICVLDDPNAA